MIHKKPPLSSPRTTQAMEVIQRTANPWKARWRRRDLAGSHGTCTAGLWHRGHITKGLRGIGCIT